MSQPPVLFLSHAGIDSEAALRLAEQIESSPEARRCGLKVWIDKRSLVAGRSWQEQLEDAIAKQSTAFGVYLTRAGAENWVRLEIQAALSRVIGARRDKKAYPFVPILAEDAGDIARLPLFAQQYQGVSLGEGPAAVQKLIAAVLNRDPSQVQLAAEPFRGLAAFGSSDAHLFFGRQDDTAKLVDRLRHTRLVVAVGDSGSGKSSLVKAGMVPAFREGLLADPNQTRPDSRLWHVVEMRPLASPVESLIKAVSDSARDVQVNAELLGNAFKSLREKQAGAFRDVLREGAPTNAQVLLVVDQFEELWTQTADEPRKQFLDGLLEVSDSGSPVRVVATLRRDYLFQTGTHPALRDRLAEENGKSIYKLRRIADAKLRECIEKPLALAGVAAAEAHALAEEILRDAGDQPGDLALIEMALHETWRARAADERLLDVYIRIGRVEGALPRAAEAALGLIGEKRVPLAEAVFLRLANQSPDGGVTRRVARKAEFFPDRWQVAQQLASAEGGRLLVLGRGAEEGVDIGQESPGEVSDDVTAELAHEQLATQWPRYQTWLREAGEDKRKLDRLIERTRRWVANKKTVWDFAAGYDLEEFSQVQKTRPLWLSPSEVTFLHRSKAQRILTKAAMALGFVVVIVVVGWYIQVQQRQIVEAQAAAIWNRLDLGASLADREFRALHDLRVADPDIKLRVLGMLGTDPGLAERFLRKPDLLTRAAMGLDSDLRERALEQIATTPIPREADVHLKLAAATLGGKLESSGAAEELLTAIASTTDRVQRKELVLGLAGIAGMLTADQASREFDPMLKAFVSAPGVVEKGQLRQGLTGLANRLTADQASQALEPLLKVIAEAPDNEAWNLGQGLMELAGRLTADQTLPAIELLVKNIGSTGSDNRKPLALMDGLEVLTGRLSADRVPRALELFLTAIASTTDENSLTSLGHGLAGLAGRLTEDQAARALEPMLKVIMLTGSGHRELLGEGLAALAGLLTGDQASRAVEPFLKAIASTDEDRKFVLGQGLARLVGQLPADHQSMVSKVVGASAADKYQQGNPWLERFRVELKADQEPLVLLMNHIAPPFHNREQPVLIEMLVAVAGGLSANQASQALLPFLSSMNVNLANGRLEYDRYLREALGQGLAALVGNLQSDQVVRAMNSLLFAIESTNDEGLLAVLEQGLATLVGRLSAEQASTAVVLFLAAIASTKDERQLNTLGQGLAVLFGQVPADQVPKVERRLLKAIESTTDENQMRALGQGLAELVSKLPDKDAVDVLQVLENPFTAGPPTEALLEALRDRFPTEIPADAGLWQVIEWAQARE